ncbi:MAG: single-stranded DNA-binding protein [Planctomycetes bacterium TMED75]|nr:single-stranded DNA-binding protein [Planctomycetaceae bacterium]OUU94915.1 MAG: single-stranded DNA-binding protein [Planctomycetes bacterium TMED75]
MKIQTVVNRLRKSTRSLDFAAPVTHVYAPLDYASQAVDLYLEKYARKGVEALFLGMNPGPWGMAQTGIPFGEVDHVRRFLHIDCAVGRPKSEHPRRPVEGFQCQRSEVSGRRLWGWVESRFETAEEFFDRFFVWNWCPLAFLEETGRNRTPDKLPATERQALEEICDSALCGVVDCIEPARVIGIGAYAKKRAERALKGRRIQVDTILHPSPASPMANRGWAPQAEAQLQAMGVPLGGAAAGSAK